MAILERLAREEGEQFVLASHSPQLLNAAPSGSIRVCMAGQAVPFTVQPDQLLLLSDLGAMDQMELVPLLVNRVVVFVENKSDRKLLEAFARKHWGAKKQQAIWRHLTFLYTYQGPIEARVLDLARQVRDIVTSPGLESAVTTRFLAIGDRDYRTDKTRLKALRDRNSTAKSDAYKLDFKLVLWEENEVENYLLDLEAILRALDSNAAATAKKTAWRSVRGRFIREWERRLGDQRERVWVRVAERIQQEDRRLSLTTAMGQAQEEVPLEDMNLAHWCDAKKVLSGLRGWLQQEGFPFHLTQEEVIHHMNAVPLDVQRTLRLLQRLKPTRRRGTVART